MQSQIFNLICLYLTVVGAAPVPQQEAAQCVEHLGSDRSGGDYSAVYTGSTEDCLTICAADANCVTAQYSIGNGHCYLKSSAQALFANEGVNTYDCRLPAEPVKEEPQTPAPAEPQPPQHPVAGTEEVNGRTCTTKPSYDRPGGDYANVFAPNFHSCVEACAKDAQCLTAQYLNNNCYLKSAVNEGHDSEIVDTVDCAAAAVAEEPKAEEPKAEEPKAEEPKAEEPKAEEPKAEEPKVEGPIEE